MMAHIMFGCGLLLLLVSTATAFDISFSSSIYYSQVATLEDPIGKVIVEPELVYNDTDVAVTFTTKDYNLYRSDARYFSIDDNGTVTLKTMLPYRRLYIFQISLLYTVTLETNETNSGFLTSDVRVQAIGPVHFDNTSYRIVTNTSIQVYEVVYNFRKHVVYNASAFRSVYFEFDYVYSSYFAIDATSGELYLRRALYPGTFSVRIEIEYDVTLKNGTVFSDDDYVYATVVAVGCNAEEEIKALWPKTYPCSAFTAPCGDMDNNQYFSGGYATRVCNANGDWMPPDYSSCKVKGNAGSFGLVWMTFSTSSGTYVLSQLKSITQDIENLFPSGAVNNIIPVSGFRSNVQYGFMMGFSMRVVPSQLSDSRIRSAQLRLSVAYRFGRIYLRSSRTIQGRGLRIFNTTAQSQCDIEPAYSDSQYLQVCSGKKCNCTDTTIKSNDSCTTIKLRERDEEASEPTSRNSTGPSYLSLNATDYYGEISAFAPIGSYILTVGYNITGNSVANISNFYYDLSGYYSDYFKIDRRKGHLTVNDDLSNRTYSLDVSFFYTVTYTNGTVGHNYAESDIYITAYVGLGFNTSSHYMAMDTDYVVNQTILVTMTDFLTYDESFILESKQFYYISDRRFSVDPDTGDIKIIAKLDPLRYHYVRVYLRYNGTINTTGQLYSSTTSMLIRIYTLGCFEMENGNVVWPASHICMTQVHKCEDIDQAFNPGGMVTRYCTSDGTWLDADYSQCSFKPGTNPFVHLYLTFYTGSSSHILRNLQNILRTGGGLLSQLSAKSVTPYNIKDSVVRYGMVVTLRGEVIPNDTILTSINTTIYNSRSFARIRLQTTGNGIEGFKTSSECEYPTHPSDSQNASSFIAVCKTGPGVTCKCPVINNTVGLCADKPTTSTPSPSTGPPREEYYNCLGNDTYIFIGNGSSIEQSILTGDTRLSWNTLVETELPPLGIDVSIADCTLFYSVGSRNRNMSIGKIIAVNLSDTSNRTIIHDCLGYPLQVAVNWITKRLYWCDRATIEYSEFYGGNREKLQEDVASIQTIALDPCSDHIYWITEESGVIFKMKLDGTNKHMIISKNNQSPNSLVIDFISSRLYWASKRMIQTSDLKGENRSIVCRTMIRRPNALSLYGDILYWAEWSNSRIIMYNTSGMNSTLVDNVNRTAAIYIMDRSRQLRYYVFVEFSSSSLNVSASDDSLTVTLVSSGNTLSESFIIGVIVEANNSSESPARAGSDFTPGQYNVTFAPGATTATANIPISAGGNSDEIKQFSLRLFIDGAAYQQCILSGSVSTATVSIIPAEELKKTEFI